MVHRMTSDPQPRRIATRRATFPDTDIPHLFWLGRAVPRAPVELTTGIINHRINVSFFTTSMGSQSLSSMSGLSNDTDVLF
jgi:hypothetical protein